MTALPRTQLRLMDIAWVMKMGLDSPAAEKFPDEERGASIPSREENLEGGGQQGFEGPEKTLEIEFDPDVGHEDGLRAIRREQWDAILEQVGERTRPPSIHFAPGTKISFPPLITRVHTPT